MSRKIAPRAPATIASFMDEFAVVCPRCSGRALVRPGAAATPARLTCSGCGASRTWASAARGMLDSRNVARWRNGEFTLGNGADPHFRLPLWLQASCPAGVLWAYNERHLDFLRDYVSAEDRRRPIRVPNGFRNSLLESRLPRWMKLAKHRAEILSALEKMRARASDRR